MSEVRKDMTLFVIGALIVCAAALARGARVYSGGYLRPDSWIGIAWDLGGLEVYNGRPAIFLCPAHYDYDAGIHWDNPLAPLFPDLVADC